MMLLHNKNGNKARSGLRLYVNMSCDI